MSTSWKSGPAGIARRQEGSGLSSDFGLSAEDAERAGQPSARAAEFYEAVLAQLGDQARDGKLAANWVINELFGRLNKDGQVD